MRAILGGTFDPVHLGHLRAALAAGAALGARQVTLQLAARPWHRDVPCASVADRWAMLRLAVADANAGRLGALGDVLPDSGTIAQRTELPALAASSDHESASSGPSYTVATLAAMDGEAPLVWLLGDDALAGVNTWHRADELATLCHLVVFARSEASGPRPAPPPGFHHVACASELGRQRCGGIHYLSAAMADISATEARARIARQADASALLSPQVWAYIRRNGLYGAVGEHSAGRRGGEAGRAKSKQKI